MILNNQLVLGTSAASLLVIFGVVVKNSLEQLGMSKHVVGNYIGMGLFILGWMYTAYILSLHKSNKMLVSLASIGVVLSVLMMKTYMAEKQTPPMMFPLIFVISWILIGLESGSHLSGYKKYLGLIATLMVLISMMNMLPFQRKNNIVDGPGMPFFVIAWIIIVFLNSNRQI